MPPTNLLRLMIINKEVEQGDKTENKPIEGFFSNYTSKKTRLPMGQPFILHLQSRVHKK